MFHILIDGGVALTAVKPAACIRDDATTTTDVRPKRGGRAASQAWLRAVGLSAAFADLRTDDARGVLSMNPVEPRLIDLMLAELEVQADPELYPDRQIDRGVVPWAMAAYLRQAEHFPVAPLVVYMGQKFRPIAGGRVLWAAQAAHWQLPIRCVIHVACTDLPAELWTRTLPFSEQATLAGPYGAVDATQTQVLCFSRALDLAERMQVESDLADLSASARRAGLSLFAKILSVTWAPNWEDGRVLSFRTQVSGNAADRSLGIRWAEVISNWRHDGLPLLAWNGRAC
jgi:hypothetical protein